MIVQIVFNDCKHVMFEILWENDETWKIFWQKTTRRNSKWKPILNRIKYFLKKIQTQRRFWFGGHPRNVFHYSVSDSTKITWYKLRLRTLAERHLPLPTNSKMAHLFVSLWIEPFRGLYHVNCLCNSFFGPFMGPWWTVHRVCDQTSLMVVFPARFDPKNKIVIWSFSVSPFS